MGTHPIFESDFDCLTDSNRSEKWPPLKLQLLKRSEIKKFRITAQARKKLPRTRMSRLVKVTRETMFVVDNRNRRKKPERLWPSFRFEPFPALTVSASGKTSRSCLSSATRTFIKAPLLIPTSFLARPRSKILAHRLKWPQLRSSSNSLSQSPKTQLSLRSRKTRRTKERLTKKESK